MSRCPRRATLHAARREIYPMYYIVLLILTQGSVCRQVTSLCDVLAPTENDDYKWLVCAKICQRECYLTSPQTSKHLFSELWTVRCRVSEKSQQTLWICFYKPRNIQGICSTGKGYAYTTYLTEKRDSKNIFDKEIIISAV